MFYSKVRVCFLWTMCRDLNQTLLYMMLFRFVLKTDDDVFVEIFHLFNFVSAVYGFSPGPSLVRPSITTTLSNSMCFALILCISSLPQQHCNLFFWCIINASHQHQNINLTLDQITYLILLWSCRSVTSFLLEQVSLPSKYTNWLSLISASNINMVVFWLRRSSRSRYLHFSMLN